MSAMGLKATCLFFVDLIWSMIILSIGSLSYGDDDL
jgi:hypothetical protein